MIIGIINYEEFAFLWQYIFEGKKKMFIFAPKY